MLKKNAYSKISVYSRLWAHLDNLQRRNFSYLLVLMIVVSIVEIVTLGSIAPFFSILGSSDLANDNAIIRKIVALFEITTKTELVLYATTIFCGISILASMLRFMLFKKTTTLSFITGAELGQKIYERTLHQSYLTHSRRNSSEIISAITAKTTALIYQAIMPVLHITSGALILIAISIVIFWTYPVIAVILAVSYTTIYFFIVRYTKNFLRKHSEIVASNQTGVIKSLQEGLGGIRDVIIDGTQNFYAQLFKKTNYQLQLSLAHIHFIGGVPRFVIEPFSILVMSVLALYLSQGDNGLLDAIPVLAILAYAAQRMLPLFQILFSAWASLMGGLKPVSDALDLLDQTAQISSDHSSVRFSSFRSLQLRDCSFGYEDGKRVLTGVNLSIKSGENIGIIGETGGGKSTLLDLLMALIQPAEGQFLVDDTVVSNDNSREWQKLIGHVSQNIFVSDDTVIRNIAFSIPDEEIDLERAKMVVDAVGLTDTINTLPDGYFTRVGERGARLSGGQIQRIGIARALYKQISILILDEATSALDEQTEELVMKSLSKYTSKITLIMVSHRRRSLRYCDRILEVVDGVVKLG